MLASRCSVSFSLANTYKRTYTMAYGFQDSRLQIGESLELLTFLLKGKKEGGGCAFPSVIPKDVRICILYIVTYYFFFPSFFDLTV